jgi:phosphomannomutase / phosphoglucomutase
MLDDMAERCCESGADLALGFDGDGDRCGVVDDEGHEIFADKMGVILARDLAALLPGRTFVADVKSTGLFAADPVLRGTAQGRLLEDRPQPHEAPGAELGALAGFEKSGHYFLAAAHRPRLRLRHARRGRDLQADGPQPGQSPADLARALPRTWSTPTMSPFCPDTEKYAVLERIAGPPARARHARRAPIAEIVTVNGARVMLDNGAWGLVRASSNTPNLVVVCESPASEAEMRAIFADLDAVIRTEPAVGAYDQTI